MMIDLTVKITQKLQKESPKFEKMAALGHLGTHFDVMNKEFSTDNFIRKGKLVNVDHIKERDICIEDLPNTDIKEKDFILFHTGFLEQEGYGTKNYFTNHPQLSRELIDYLLNKKISLIGIDAAGIRRGNDHTKTDQYCADRGVFIIENITNLNLLQQAANGKDFTVYTFPVNFEGMTGLPCRVAAYIPE